MLVLGPAHSEEWGAAKGQRSSAPVLTEVSSSLVGSSRVDGKSFRRSACYYISKVTGTMLASVSYDSTVKLWETGTGALRQTLDTKPVVHTLSFSEDGTLLQTNRGRLPIPSNLPTYTPANRLPLSPFIFIRG